MTSKPNSVCALRLSALGDCVNVFGMLGAISREDPRAQLLWILDRRFAPLFRDSEGTDIIPMLPVDFSGGVFKAFWHIKNQLKGRRFDCLLDLQTSIKASACALAVPAKVKFGYDRERGREGQFLFINRKVPSPANPHVVAGYMAFARAAGYGDLQPKWDFRLSDEELAPYLKLSEQDPVFTICPASAKTQKNWNADGYARMADYAVKNGYRVVLAGSPNETEMTLCAQIASRAGCKCLNLCGQTNLRQLCALLCASSLALCPDSACMHICSAVNTPVIGLFAVHDPRRVGSWKFPDLWVSVYKDLAREECGQGHIPWRYRVRNEHAMDRISTEMVKDAFDYALDHYAPNPDDY
ncbi:MAG: glycosyltransferase family 9 protein [Succinivibrio sp.]|jgi:heptosyltransferase I|nr:glycosyltransferase family 9 protein [Succinivibrio sp.]